MAIRTDFTSDVGQPTPQSLGNVLIKAENKLDFSAKNVDASDVVEAIEIPAGALLLMAGVIVKTEEGTTATATFGDATTADGVDASIDLDTAALYRMDEDTDTYGVGKYYASADTLDLTVSADLDTAVVIVWAIWTMIEDY